jgi:large conductance mechanosensitive channel
VNLENAYVILHCDPSNLPGNKTCSYTDFPTPKSANEAHIVTITYGNFIQALINLIIIGAVLYLLVKSYAAAFVREEPKATKECPFCCSEISMKAVKCAFCTTTLPEKVVQPDILEIKRAL